MGIIKADKLVFEYIRRDEEGNVEGITRAVDEVDLDVQQGDFIAVLGHNGSGKSTLAKHINAILVPTQGTMWVNGRNTKDPEELWNVRQSAGMVFQNPDNQIIGTVVEEDVGFGPENLGVPTDEIWQRVEDSLRSVGMIEYRHHSPNKLSGGQKQRVAIARALAANPKILLCDEATSALDPQTTQSILQLLKQINKDYGITIVIITHEMSVVREICSHVAIIGGGRLVEQGRVSEIFSHPKTKEAKELIVKGKGEERRTLEGHQKDMMKGKCCIRIVFSVNSSFEPVIANMVLRFGQPINILRADTKNVEGIARGEMILSLPDDVQMQADMKEYLTQRGLAVEEVDGYVV